MFGTCPRVLCEHQNLLPIGKSDIPHEDTLKMYCPRCQDVYPPQKSKYENIDGAYFGTSFAHMFVVNYPLLFIKPKQEFVGTVFGFKVNQTSINHPPKIDYVLSTNTMKMIPRPLSNFATVDDSKMPKRNFISYVPPKQ